MLTYAKLCRRKTLENEVSIPNTRLVLFYSHMINTYNQLLLVVNGTNNVAHLAPNTLMATKTHQHLHTTDPVPMESNTRCGLRTHLTATD